MASRLSNRLRKKNLEIFKNLMNYKHDMSISDKWWGEKAKELQEIINEINNDIELKDIELKDIIKPIHKKPENLDYKNKKKIEIRKKISKIFEEINKRFNSGHQKFKYGTFKPLLQKELAIRELMEKIMTYFEDGKGNRQKLFNIKKLKINSKLRKIYNEAIKLNKEDMNKEMGNKEKLILLKKKIDSLNTIYKDIINSDLKFYNNLKNARNINEFCDNIKKGYSTIVLLINKKINEQNINKEKLMEIYNFIIGYNNLLKLLELEISINEVEIKEKIKQKIAESSSTGS